MCLLCFICYLQVIFGPGQNQQGINMSQDELPQPPGDSAIILFSVGELFLPYLHRFSKKSPAPLPHRTAFSPFLECAQIKKIFIVSSQRRRKTSEKSFFFLLLLEGSQPKINTNKQPQYPKRTFYFLRVLR